MAYFHQRRRTQIRTRIRTRIQTRIRTPFPMVTLVTLYCAGLFPLVRIRIQIPVQRVSQMVTVPILGMDLHPYSIHLNQGIRV